MINEQQPQLIQLPSKGIFYSNKCSEVYVHDMNMSDEQLIYSPNLLKSGQLVDKLLEKKVKPVDGKPFIPVAQMLLGDRLALLIFLRCTMDNMYKFLTLDSKGETFEAQVDLSTLNNNISEVEAEHLPNQNGEFDFILPRSGSVITYRLMTGEDEIEIRKEKKRMSSDSIISNLLMLERIVTSIDGERERGNIIAFLRKMNLTDGQKLAKEIERITPKINLSLELTDPHGEIIQRKIEFGADFFFPNI